MWLNYKVHSTLLLLLGCSFVSGQQLRDYSQSTILQYENEQDDFGGYRFSYLTSDGTSREEVGEIINPGQEDESLAVIGEFAYEDTNGQLVMVSYKADENGYRIIKSSLFTPIDANSLTSNQNNRFTTSNLRNPSRGGEDGNSVFPNRGTGIEDEESYDNVNRFTTGDSNFQQNNFQQNRLPDNRLQQNRFSGNRFQQNRPDNRFQQNRPDNRFQQNRPDNRFQQDSLPDNRFQQTRLPDNTFQQNRVPQNRLPNNRIQQNRFQQNRPQENRFQQNRFQTNRLPQNRFQQNRIQQNRFQQNRFQQNRFQQNRFQQNTFNNRQISNRVQIETSTPIPTLTTTAIPILTSSSAPFQPSLHTQPPLQLPILINEIGSVSTTPSYKPYGVEGHIPGIPLGYPKVQPLRPFIEGVL